MSATNFSDAKLSLVSLSPRPGHFLDYHLNLLVAEDLETALMRVEPGTHLEVDATAQSLEDGVLVSLRTEVPIVYQCARCLDEVDDVVELAVEELYFTPQACERIVADEGEDSAAELLVLEGDEIALEPLLRDAILADIEFSPLCEPECPGLCEECGEPWRDLPADHAHEVLDPRFSALADLFADSQTGE